MSGLLGYLANFLTNSVIFALFALGLNLQFGFTGLLNFGHVAFMGLGAYTMAILSLKGWPLWAAVLAGVVVAAMMSFLIGLPSLRLREDYLAIVTIGFAEIIRMVLNNETWLTRGPQGIFGFPVPFGNLKVSPPVFNWIFLAFSLIIIGVVFWGFQYAVRSPWGRVLKAIREDEDAAIALGKNTRLFKLQSLAMGAAVAGLAGVLFAFFMRYVNPRNFMPLITFEAWMIVVLGGAGNNWGAVVGSLVYFGIHSLTRKYELAGFAGVTGAQIAALRVVFIGVLLVLLMMFRPQGILGRKEELTLDR